MRNQTILHDEIESELKNLGTMDCGSEDYKVAAEGLTKLLDRAIEMEKLDISQKEAEANRDNEIEKLMLQIEEDKKTRRSNVGLNLLTVAAGVGTAILGTFVTLKFEETGSVSTIAGKEWTRKLFNKVKWF